MSDLTLDVGQAVELKEAFRRGDWTNAEIKSLCEGDTLGRVRSVIRGLAEIKLREHLIDCSTRPFISEGWGVLPDDEQLPNRFRDILNWDSVKLELRLVEGQQGGRSMTGHQLREVLKAERVLPANLLDYLLKPENQHLIPEEWKTSYVFFWGTIYCDSGGSLYVRCLDWNGRQWFWSCRWFGSGWGGVDPAALLAS